MNEQIHNQAIAVATEFRGVHASKVTVHTKSANLAMMLDLLVENNLLTPVKRRRQGKRGARGARNYLLRKALWWARSYNYSIHKLGTPKK